MLLPGPYQLFRHSTSRRRDIGHIPTTHLLPGTSRQLQTAPRTGTVLRTGNRLTTLHIIRSTQDTRRCRSILLPLREHMVPFPHRQVRRRPCRPSRRPVTKRRLQMMSAPRPSARRRKGVEAVRTVGQSQRRSPNVEQMRLARRPRWWPRHLPHHPRMTLLMTTAVPWRITHPVVWVVNRCLLSSRQPEPRTNHVFLYRIAIIFLLVSSSRQHMLSMFFPFVCSGHDIRTGPVQPLIYFKLSFRRR